MQVPTTEAKGEVEAEMIVPDRKSRRALIEAIRASAAGKVTPGPDAAHSQDFLYDENGLPR